ncbi:MAG: putative peptidoglycan biosynthesis protein MurJ [Pelotomaculum sp. PtaU1.Bin035]|nr:MAG: putative peptidoglycan biosynthesis protein MurJ [Pelotomaculum sp. PtaU1.Bin035]
MNNLLRHLKVYFNSCQSSIVKVLSKYTVYTVGSVVIINIILAAVALLKDMFLTSYFGTSAQADAFLLAYFLPDAAGNNLLAFSLGIACVPVFSKILIANQPCRLKLVITSITIYSIFFTSLLLVFSCLFRNNIIHGLGAGFSEDTCDLCIKLFLIILPSAVVFLVISIGTAVLQVHNIFNIPALAPVLFNFIFLAGILFSCLLQLPALQGVYILAVTVLLGVIAEFFLIFHAIRRYRINIWARLRFKELVKPSADIKELFKIFLPYIIILLSYQVVYSVERYLASSLELGSVAGLSYAFRLSQFPLWVFVSAIGTVALPYMSKATGLGNDNDLKDILLKSIRMILILTLPLTSCFFVLRVPIVSILFQRGAFDANSVQITAGILTGYSLTIVTQGIVIICTRAFLAANRVMAPLLAAIVSSIVNIYLDFLLVNIMGAPGLGYGASIGSLLNCLLIIFFINRLFKLAIQKQLWDLAKILTANIPFFATVYLFSKAWCLIELAHRPEVRPGYTIILVIVCFSVYLMSLRMLKVNLHISKTIIDRKNSYEKN